MNTIISLSKSLTQKYPECIDYNFIYAAVLGMKVLSVSKLQSLIYVSDIKTYLGKAVELDPEHVETRRILVEFYVKLPEIRGGSISISKKYKLGKTVADRDIYPRYGLKLLKEYIENFNYTDISPLGLAYLCNVKIQAGLINKLAVIEFMAKVLTLRADLRKL